jgi:uncharacterized membrane protein YkvA (DUF1232 family)
MNPLARLLALMRDPRTPKLPRFLVVAAILYTLSPFDLVSEAFFTPLFGLIDDATLLWLSWRWLFKSDPDKAPQEPVPPPPASLPPPRQ